MPAPAAGRLIVIVAVPAALGSPGFGTSFLPASVAVSVQPVICVNAPRVIGCTVPVTGILMVPLMVAAIVAAALLVALLVVASVVATVVATAPPVALLVVAA